MSVDSQQFGEMVQQVKSTSKSLEDHMRASDQTHKDFSTQVTSISDFIKEAQTLIKLGKWLIPTAVLIWPMLSFILKLIAIVKGGQADVSLVSMLPFINLWFYI